MTCVVLKSCRAGELHRLAGERLREMRRLPPFSGLTSIFNAVLSLSLSLSV